MSCNIKNISKLNFGCVRDFATEVLFDRDFFNIFYNLQFIILPFIKNFVNLRC